MSVQPIDQNSTPHVTHERSISSSFPQQGIRSWFGRVISKVPELLWNQISHLFKKNNQSKTEFLDLPSEPLTQIFSYLDGPNRSTRTTCRRFYAAYPENVSSRSKELCQLDEKNHWLSDLGIQCPPASDIQGHEIEFLAKVQARLKKINELLPENVQYRGSLVDLIMNNEKLRLLWQTSYQYSLNQCFGRLAGTRESMTLEEKATHIQNWLNNEENTKTVTELGLSFCNLFMLPHEIGKFINLTELGLSSNQLTTLPPEIGKLINLTTLWLSNNQLTSLPPEIENLIKLTVLWLSCNQLTSLPPEIVKLINLTKLRLSYNQLTSLPPEIGNLINLTSLRLSGNQLTSLPPEIGKFINLTKLGLDDNKLTSLPPEIGNLSCRIFLDDKQHTSLLPEISKLEIHKFTILIL
jgi:hypothetical protein